MTVKTLAEMDVPSAALDAAGQAAAIANLRANPDAFPRPDNWSPLEAALYSQDMLVIITNTPVLYSAPAFGGAPHYMHHIDQSRYNPFKLQNRAAAGLSQTPWYMTYTEQFAYFADPIFWAKRWIATQAEYTQLMSLLAAHGQQIAQDMAPSTFDKLAPLIAVAGVAWMAAPAIMGAMGGATTAGAAAGTAATTTAAVAGSAAGAAIPAGAAALGGLGNLTAAEFITATQAASAAAGVTYTSTVADLALASAVQTGALSVTAANVYAGAILSGAVSAADVTTGLAQTYGIGGAQIAATTGLNLQDVSNALQKTGATVSSAVNGAAEVAGVAGTVAQLGKTIHPAAAANMPPIMTAGSAGGGSSLLLWAAVALAAFTLI